MQAFDLDRQACFCVMSVPALNIHGITVLECIVEQSASEDVQCITASVQMSHMVRTYENMQYK